MPKNFTRANRLEEQILKEAASIVYSEVKDPRIGFITLTDIELSKDLKHAIIYYTVLEEKDKLPTQDALKSSKGFIRSELAKRLTVYQVPELSFKYDTAIEHAAMVSNLLEQINLNNKD